MKGKIDRVCVVCATLSGNIHEIIDSSEVMIFGSMFPQIDVFVQTDRARLIRNNVSKLTSLQNVTYHHLGNLGRRSALHDFAAAFIELFIFLLKGDKKTLFIFSYVNMFSCHIVNFFSKITGKHVIVCCHNELEVVCLKKPRMYSYWQWLIHRFYTHTNFAKNLYLLVLGRNIADNYLHCVGNKNIKKILAVEHPYFDKKNCSHSIKKFSQKIRIGVIGFVSRSPERGFENIKQLAERLKHCADIEINIISRIDADMISELPPNVKILGTPGSFLSRDEYEKNIEILDYIYFPYPKDSFKFTASGAILEAMVKLKVVLMQSNDYFLHLSELFGRFGCFVDQVDDQTLIGFIRSEQHDDLIRQLLKVRLLLKPESMRSLFEKAINTMEA